MAHPGGRPTDYNLQLAQEICDEISNSDKGLKDLCAANSNWPHRNTIMRWLLEKEEFSGMYAKAKMAQVDLMVEDIIAISDDNSRDTLIKIDSKGNEYEACNSEWIARSRLRVDSRKWLASKLVPRVYGERNHTTVDATLRQEDAITDLA
jgi:hypothetical protein